MTEFKDEPQSPTVSRRGLLKLAGAGAIGAAAGGFGLTLRPDENLGATVVAQQEEQAWDEEADVVVAGSGGAGASSAISAFENGASVIILEKSDLWGGTTGHSGGGSFVSGNSKMVAAGIETDHEAMIRYICRVAYPNQYHPDSEFYGLNENDYQRIVTYYETAPEAFDWFEEIGALVTVMDPNYPLYNGLIPEAQGLPLAGQLLFAASEDGAAGGGGDMMRQFFAAVEEREIPVLMEHRVERVVLNEDGRVIGVEATNADGDVVRIGANAAVIFASGGFANNETMRNAYIRGPIFGGGAVASNQGDFVHIAGSLGATFTNMQNAWLSQSILDNAIGADGRIDTIASVPGDSMIQVNRFGHRVMNEKMEYQDRTHVHFNWDPMRAEYTNRVLFMIYDERTATEYAGSFIIPAEDGDASHVVTDDTLEELAENIEQKLTEVSQYTGNLHLDTDFLPNLRATIGGFNKFAVEGVDRHYLRGESPIEQHNNQFFYPPIENPYPNPMLHPIADEGPYYCIFLVGSSFDTKGGPLTNNRGQVLNADGEVIPGLYGVGNCVAQTTAHGYPGPGSTLGPTLTYGYIAGRTAAAEIDGGSEDDEDEATATPQPTTTAEPTAEPTTEPEPTSTEEEDDDQASGGATHTVEMTQENVFVPDQLTITVGDTVTWVTVGTIPHSSTADPEIAINPDTSVQLPEGAEPWDSGTLATGEEFSHTFEVPGEYTYFCIPHELANMIGHITVEE